MKNCKSFETRFAKASRRSELCSRGKRPFGVSAKNRNSRVGVRKSNVAQKLRRVGAVLVLRLCWPGTACGRGTRGTRCTCGTRGTRAARAAHEPCTAARVARSARGTRAACGTRGTRGTCGTCGTHFAGPERRAEPTQQPGDARKPGASEKTALRKPASG